MIKFKDYFNRKFYSRFGRASKPSGKLRVVSQNSKEREELTVEFLLSEIQKAQSDNFKPQIPQKKVLNTSSFLSTNRETYMKSHVKVI
jgi:hypothetical protein